ncbi:MAG: protoheme IX farnesyltransferase [Alphaproteobacteria bacterium]|nr:protoheme IX farnesyltransferase [Alphaproteobacteria bacterium]
MLTLLNTTASILKLRISLFIALAALVGLATGQRVLDVAEATVFCLAVLGASCAAGGFNQYYERDTDRLMARTAGRPFASGQLQPGAVWPVTFLALLSASVLMAWSVGGSLAALFVFLGAATYGLVYTVWLKKRSVWNVVIGGAAGSFALLAGAAAAGPSVEPSAWLLALVLFLWTPPHFWSLAAARQDDYRNASVPMLPAVTAASQWAPMIFAHVAALVALSLAPLWFGFGAIYGVFAGVGGAVFLMASWRLMRAPGAATAMLTFHASLTHFALLALGVLLDEGVRWVV